MRALLRSRSGNTSDKAGLTDRSVITAKLGHAQISGRKSWSWMWPARVATNHRSIELDNKGVPCGYGSITIFVLQAEFWESPLVGLLKLRTMDGRPRTTPSDDSRNVIEPNEKPWHRGQCCITMSAVESTRHPLTQIRSLLQCLGLNGTIPLKSQAGRRNRPRLALFGRSFTRLSW